MRGWMVLLCIAVLSAAAPRLARADEVTPEAKAEAKTHADAATQHFNVQQYEQAADEYKQAYLLDPQPGYLYAAAQAQRLGGDCTKAILSYKAFLRTKPKDESKAKKNIERCEQELKDHPPPVEPPVGPTQPVTPAAPVVVTPPPPPPPKMVKRPWTKDVLGHVMVGGGLAVAATGAILFITGRSAIADLNNAGSYDEFNSKYDAIDKAKLKQTIGVSAMAVGGGLIVGGIIHYVLHSRPVAERSVSAVLTPSGTTLYYTRSF